MTISAQNVGRTVDEVSADDHGIRDEAESSITFLSQIVQKLRVQVVTKSECVDLELEVRVLVFIIFEFLNVTCLGGDIRYTVSQ